MKVEAAFSVCKNTLYVHHDMHCLVQLTYKEIDPEMGTWADIEKFSKKFELMLECMVNHISPASDEFQDFLEKGENSKTADMWIDWDKFWPEGENFPYTARMRSFFFAVQRSAAPSSSLFLSICQSIHIYVYYAWIPFLDSI